MGPWNHGKMLLFAMCRWVKSKGYDGKLLKACKHVLLCEVAVIGQLYPSKKLNPLESIRIVHFIECIKFFFFFFKSMLMYMSM